MASAPAERWRPSTVEVLAAAASGVLALGGAIALPLLAAAQPGEGIPSISPSDAAWWVVVTFILAQSIALLWVGRSPLAVVPTDVVISVA